MGFASPGLKTTQLALNLNANAMHMAINWDKNLFDVNTDQPYSEQANRIRQEVQMLVDVVEALDLNTRIWAKAM